MVTIGVLMEFFVAAHSIREGVRLENTIALANERVATNELYVASLTNQTVRLSLRLEELRSNNIVLQSKLLPRWILPDKRKQIIDGLKGAPKATVKVQARLENFEPKNFAMQIADCLREAGFDVVYEDGILGGPPEPGITYLVPSTNPAPPSAVSISSVLSSVGLNNPSFVRINESLR